MRTLLATLLFTAAASLPSASNAQTYTAAKIQFSDMGTFTQQQLEDASGIHPGTRLTVDDLSAAAQRLVDTGYFDSMAATVEGKVTAVTVEFDDKTTPLDHMLHIGFENFVWLTPAEITTAIRTKIPLFNGYLLDNSPHIPELKAALTAALAAKSIPADVDCDDFDPTLLHPQRELACRVARPGLRVSNVKLSGVTQDLVPLVQKSVNATVRTAYTQGPAHQTTADRILAPLLDAGYIQATLTDIAPTPSPAINDTVPIVFAATLQPGDIYKLASITFAGTPLLSSDAFAASAKLHPGDIASQNTLMQTLQPLDSAYRRQGYMDVVIHATPTLDSATHQVAYTITVDPGEQYHLHQVTADNLDPAARAAFDQIFSLKPGDLYNPEYVGLFLQKNTAVKSLAGYSASFKSYADPNTHTVDLVINFAKGGSTINVR